MPFDGEIKIHDFKHALTISCCNCDEGLHWSLDCDRVKGDVDHPHIYGENDLEPVESFCDVFSCPMADDNFWREEVLPWLKDNNVSENLIVQVYTTIQSLNTLATVSAQLTI